MITEIDNKNIKQMINNVRVFFCHDSDYILVQWYIKIMSTSMCYKLFLYWIIQFIATEVWHDKKWEFISRYWNFIFLSLIFCKYFLITFYCSKRFFVSLFISQKSIYLTCDITLLYKLSTYMYNALTHFICMKLSVVHL